MIKLDKPTDNIEKVFNDCLPRRLTDEKARELLLRLQSYKEDIIRESEYYDQKAPTADLYLLHSTDNKTGKQVKEDMEDLYGTRFRKANGGSYYTRMRFSAKFCPYCGRGLFSTTTPQLDHFLPKAYYPLLAVTPINLVPSCSDCNVVKSGHVLRSKSEQIFHPYYEDLPDEVWIKAEVIHDEGDEGFEEIGFVFKVDCPQDWPELMQERAKNQFEVLKLADRYPPMTGEVLPDFLVNVKFFYREFGVERGKSLAQECTKQCLEEKYLHKNHFKLIMLRALLEDDWFWDEFMVAKMQKEGKLK